MSLFRYQGYLAGQRPTNWGHHFYHSRVDLSHDRHTHKYRYVSEGLRFNILIQEDAKV